MYAEVAKNLRVDKQTLKYEPILYLSDFWLLKKNMLCLNETLDGSKLNLTLKF